MPRLASRVLGWPATPRRPARGHETPSLYSEKETWTPQCSPRNCSLGGGHWVLPFSVAGGTSGRRPTRRGGRGETPGDGRQQQRNNGPGAKIRHKFSAGRGASPPPKKSGGPGNSVSGHSKPSPSPQGPPQTGPPAIP